MTAGLDILIYIIYWRAKNEVNNKIRKVQRGVYELVIRWRGGEYLVQKKRVGLRFKIK